MNDPHELTVDGFDDGSTQKRAGRLGGKRQHNRPTARSERPEKLLLCRRKGTVGSRQRANRIENAILRSGVHAHTSGRRRPVNSHPA
jgi:hypothetical protein